MIEPLKFGLLLYRSDTSLSFVSRVNAPANVKNSNSKSRLKVSFKVSISLCCICADGRIFYIRRKMCKMSIGFHQGDPTSGLVSRAKARF